MGPTIWIVTSETVNRREVKDFIYAEGGMDDPDNIYDGWVAGSSHCIYLKWYAERTEEDPDTLELVARILGQPPNAHVLMDLIRGPNTQRVAWRLIKHFCDRWHPCVLRSTMPIDIADEGRLVWTMQEVAEYFGRHHRLPN